MTHVLEFDPANNSNFDTIEEAAKARREAESVYEVFLEKYEAGELGEKA